LAIGKELRAMRCALRAVSEESCRRQATGYRLQAGLKMKVKGERGALAICNRQRAIGKELRALRRVLRAVAEESCRLPDFPTFRLPDYTTVNE